ncbi:hypothetical protein ACC696_16590 [Rhizobium ruizarguesonis]
MDQELLRELKRSQRLIEKKVDAALTMLIILIVVLVFNPIITLFMKHYGWWNPFGLPDWLFG